jgi:6-phosphogluconolactonase
MIFKKSLTGGSACTFFCRGLPAITADWPKWKFIFCDERVVPFDDPECTFKVYKDSLFSKVPLTDDNFVVIDPKLPGIYYYLNNA